MANDPWDAFDPQAAAVLRSVFDHEWNQRARPMTDAFEDRELASEEAQLRAKYPDYDKNRVAILQFAIDNNLSNVEHAFHAYRGTTETAAATPPAQVQAVAPPTRAARMEELRLKPDLASQSERKALELEEREDGERKFEQTLKEANRAGARRDAIGNINSAAEIKNRQRTERAQLNPRHIDSQPRKNVDREELDLQAEDLFRAANAASTDTAASSAGSRAEGL